MQQKLITIRFNLDKYALQSFLALTSLLWVSLWGMHGDVYVIEADERTDITFYNGKVICFRGYEEPLLGIYPDTINDLLRKSLELCTASEETALFGANIDELPVSMERTDDTVGTTAGRRLLLHNLPPTMKPLTLLLEDENDSWTLAFSLLLWWKWKSLGLCRHIVLLDEVFHIRFLNAADEITYVSLCIALRICTQQSHSRFLGTVQCLLFSCEDQEQFISPYEIQQIYDACIIPYLRAPHPAPRHVPEEPDVSSMEDVD